MAEALRLASLLLLPVMPGIAAKIHELLGQKCPAVWEDSLFAWGTRLEGATLGEKVILFPRKDME